MIDGMELNVVKSNFICLSFVHNFCNVWTVLSFFFFFHHLDRFVSNRYLFYSLSCHLYLSSSNYVFIKIHKLFCKLVTKIFLNKTLYPKTIKDVLLSHFLKSFSLLCIYRQRRRIQNSSVSRLRFTQKLLQTLSVSIPSYIS